MMEKKANKGFEKFTEEKATAKELLLDRLANTIGETLREKGIWAFTEGMTELKSGCIMAQIHIWPLEVIHKQKDRLPSQTLLRVKQYGKESKYRIYRISEDEIKRLDFVKPIYKKK